jgi:catalase
VDRTFLTTRSIEFDAVVVAHGSGAIHDAKVDVLLQEAYRHSKAVAAWGDGRDLLASEAIDTEAPGVLVGDRPTAAFCKELLTAIGLHRAWDRAEFLVRG